MRIVPFFDLYTALHAYTMSAAAEKSPFAAAHHHHTHHHHTHHHHTLRPRFFQDAMFKELLFFYQNRCAG